MNSLTNPLSARPRLASAMLACATLLAHGWCLSDGAVLDDWQHQYALRENGWGLDELMKSLVIRPADFTQSWWQTKDVRWEYARPLFIFSMKLVYGVLGGNDPYYLHAYSLLLHFLSACMIARLALLLTHSARWSLIAGMIFVTYPHAVMTVQWSSSQNCVQQTALTLAALLCYARASRISLFALPGLDSNIGSGPARSGVDPASAASWGWFWLSALLWLLALLTKENALLLPPIAAAFDLAFGGRGRIRQRVPFYLVFAGVGLAFIAWRMSVVTHGMPDVYIRRPAGNWPEYLAWCSAKLLHYLTTTIWPAPMTIGPTGRFNPWVEAPGDCALMVAIVTVLFGLYALATRRIAGWWIWPLWILLSILPVVPVIATAHSGYLGGAGFAIACVLAPAHLTRSTRPTAQRSRAAQRFAASIAFAALGSGCALSVLNRWQWSGIIAAERYVPAYVLADPPASTARDVFFINLPYVNVYAKRQLDARFGKPFEAVRAHALTYSPQPILIEQRVTVEQQSANSFLLAIEGQPWFSRLMGRFLLEGYSDGHPLRNGQRVERDDMQVEIVATDAHGVRQMRFTFPRPLTDPSYCFYLSTAHCGAARLRFRSNLMSTAPPAADQENADRFDPALAASTDLRELEAAIRGVDAGDASAMEQLFAAMQSTNASIKERAEQAARPIAAAIAQATGSSLQELLLGPHIEPDALAPPPRVRRPPAPPAPPPLNPSDWKRIRDWWREGVDDALLTAIWTRRDEFDRLVKDREELPHARQWAALLLRTDLYLTGPPFPGVFESRSRDGSAEH